jgi:AraC family transcriptional regulator
MPCFDSVHLIDGFISVPKAILQLLSTANSAMESDRDTARACIAHAAALLRNTTPSARYIAEIDGSRGRLAAWQQHRLLDYIKAHLGARMDAGELAAMVNLSVSHFSRVFHTTFGDPPMAFVAKQRMQRARELILETQEPLAQIALTCGLCDQSHFTRVFRKIFGMAPSAWRRLYATPTLESTGCRGLSGAVCRTIEQSDNPRRIGANCAAKELGGLDRSG